MILECKNLTKKYGKKVAIDDFNLSIPKGKIVGLLGPNGVGKTTLIKTIAGLLKYSSGSMKIQGIEPGVETKKIVAYLPDREFLYQWMSINESINFFKKSFSDFNEDKARRLISDLNLSPKQKIKSLSKGNQERVNISLTISRDAKLFVMDEPLAAVDPSTRDKIIKIITENMNRESSMIISTHLINDVDVMFDQVVFMNEGKVVLYDDVEILRQKHNKSIEDLFKEMI
ncbi:ABC transporter ATP-binding protein [Clostridium sp.]|uniref:ABC transporter ATP-binding protein n=1 Tax=Clostridium sp. TaxID=1506 RepID=UPI002FC7E4EB